MTIAEAALTTLGRTANPSLGWGDAGLLHAVCDDAGRSHRGHETERLILAGLERRPDLWEKRYWNHRGRPVRYFRPTEKAKELIRRQFPEWKDG